MKLSILILLASALFVVACGSQSKSDKAKSQVCDARSDIQAQVKKLQGLTPATFTVNGVKDSLTAIQNDLKKIADAQPDLTASRKQQVKSANEKFTSELQSILGNIGTNLSASGAKTQLQSALQQLANAYQQSFAKVDCSG
ncbi:MAG TPA: hypothetical protein VF032_17960 [Thermoleophilaceae bacterium]